VPPLYLQEEFVNLARAGRVTANIIGSRALPPNTDSINVPRMTSGTTVAVQADGGTVSETDSVFDLITADVLTLAGQQDVSRQLVDRSIPGVDEVLFSDLARASHYNLDTAVLNSTTSNNKGLLQVGSIHVPRGSSMR
jgi:HK97 family phage major capsid protein